MDTINRIIIKNALKIFWLTLVTIASILFAGMLILQLPKVQTSIAEKAIDALSDKLDGNITIEKLHIKPFTTLVLKNVAITDKHPAVSPIDSTLVPVDTLFRAEYIIAKFSLDGLLHPESIRISTANIANAQMNLVIEDLIQEDGTIITNNNLTRIFRLQKNENPVYAEDEVFRILDIIISDMGFRLINMGSRPTPYYGGINWNDLDVKDININANGLRFKDGIMYGELENMSFKEKAGFECSKLSGSAKVGRGKTIVNDLIIKDRWSDINLPQFMMSYRSVDDFPEFIEKVKLDATLAPSVVDFRTIVFFAPQLEGNRLKADVSGTMSGCIDDFIVSDFRVNSHAGGFSGTVNGRLSGIPDVDRMRIDASVNNMKITTKGLGDFVTEWMPEGELDLSAFGKGIVFHADASARGLLNNMDAKVSMKSKDGNISATARLDDIIRQDKPIIISGQLETDHLDAGKLSGLPILGKACLKAGFTLNCTEEFSADLDSLNIKEFDINDYTYRNIRAKGTYNANALNGTVISQDPNLNFLFQGGYARSEKSQNTVYKFNASIGHADLNAINIDKRGKSLVQLRTSGNFTRTGKGDIIGRIDAGNILLENRIGRFDIGDIVLSSHSHDNRFQARLNSSFAEGVYNGTGSLIDFVKDIKGITIDRELPALTKENEYQWSGNTYDISFICHNLHKVLAFAAPGLYIENGTFLKAGVNADGDLTADISSKRIAYKKNYLKDIKMSVNNLNRTINGEVRCSEIVAASIKMNDNIFLIHANDNHFGAGFSFDNHSDPETKGELIINGEISRVDDLPMFDIDIRPSSLHYNSKEWTIQPSSINIHNGDISVDSFGVISGEQTVGLFGRISDNIEETMTLNLERFDLSIINSILPSDFGIKGAMTGVAELKSPLDDMELTVDMLCDSSYVANIPLGVIRAGMEWDDTMQKFNLFAKNELKGECNLDLNGHYTPSSRQIDAQIDLDRLNIGYAQPFLKDVFSQMGGYISGQLTAKGPLDHIALKSNNGRLDEAMLKIGYTGVPYWANGPFHINQDGVFFDGIDIRDRYNGTGKVTGSIDFDHFKDIRFNTKISVNQMEAVNLTEKEADVFYGHLFATGDVAITGPVESIIMDVNAVTEKAGQLHIPVSSSLTSSKSTNLLKFKEVDKDEFIDPYELFVLRTDKEDVNAGDFLVRLRVTARPEVQAFVEIDKASGNVLSGRGSGNITLEASEDIFNINGDYTLTSGNYRFVAMGLVGRDFTIQDGSTIRFGGDIMESSLDINARYRTKASISTLISDTTSVSNRRIVDCGIRIRDKLSNPQLSFSIEIPDLDPTIKSRVESALSTEDKVQKQFLSLILSNNFLPDEQSGIVNNSSVLYSNMTEMMASQINNIFQKLDIPLDLGLNYQPNERGNDIFDVAVSTQLFNNRVIVNGNIGNRQYSSGSQNAVAGDIDIEIKLNRSGAFRLNLFSHSADQYTNYLDNSQRNGVGITYQTEFNTFRQFFRNIFSSKKKRAENRMADEQAILNEKRVKINIER